MKKRILRAISLLLCAVLMLTALGACGGDDTNDNGGNNSNTQAPSNNDNGGSTEDNAGGSVAEADDSTTFTYEIDTGEQTYYYEEYEDNPCMQYWMSMGWDADGDGNSKKISVDVISLPAGAEQDTVNTWIGTGDYPMIMSTTYSSQKAAQLYDEGMILDITDYVEQYMPNYLAWAESHPAYANRLTFNVDGERRYLGLYALDDSTEPPWGGFCYRRDWIVKYGTNPETGAAFTGAWEGDEWVDDVVFPSGNTDPIYISDWEWMLDIFSKALADLGVTDGYACSLFYMGYLPTGDLAFGEPAGYYLDKDGKAHAGHTSDGFRAYLECMNKWYANGWIDKRFDEHASDMFFMVDMGSVYAGKVGMWYGMVGSLGSSMDTSNGDTSNLTNGMVVAGAPQPINDMYGPERCRNVEPFAYYTNSIMFGPVVFTDKCEGKDLATLFTALDYLYEPETGALLKSFGLSKEQVEEFDCQWYRDQGLEDGAYTVQTDENGHKTYHLNPVATYNQDGLEGVCRLNRFLGLSLQEDRRYDYTNCKQHWMDLWIMYDNYGQIGTEVTDQFSMEQQEQATTISNNVTTYMSVNIPKFVKGELDPTSDADWQQLCSDLEAYDVEAYCGFVDSVLG